jgi:hypothetical protein
VQGFLFLLSALPPFYKFYNSTNQTSQIIDIWRSPVTENERFLGWKYLLKLRSVFCYIIVNCSIARTRKKENEDTITKRNRQ